MDDKEKRFEKVAEVTDGRIVSIDSDEMACLCEEDEAEIIYECRTSRERAAKRLALAAFSVATTARRCRCTTMCSLKTSRSTSPTLVARRRGLPVPPTTACPA